MTQTNADKMIIDLNVEEFAAGVNAVKGLIV